MTQEDINDVMAKSMEPWQRNLAERGKGEDEKDILIARLRHAALLLAKRPFMTSGGLEMANCDAYCKELGLKPWDFEWFGVTKEGFPINKDKRVKRLSEIIRIVEESDDSYVDGGRIIHNRIGYDIDTLSEHCGLKYQKNWDYPEEWVKVIE